MEQLQSILTDLDNKAITKHQAYDLILVLFDVRQSLPDIRNKLTPMLNLCSLIDRADLSNNYGELIKIIRSEVEQCKKNIEYLSGNVA